MIENNGVSILRTTIVIIVKGPWIFILSTMGIHQRVLSNGHDLIPFTF